MRRRRFAFRGTWGGRRMEGGLFRMGAFRCQCLFHLLSYSKQFDLRPGVLKPIIACQQDKV